MALSIVIVNYGTRTLLRDCLQSIRHSGVGDLETIVVDNHSRDDSVALVRGEFPEARLIVNCDNLGFSKANNQGIQAAQGEYILLLNSDTVVLPRTLQSMTDFMAAHPEAGAAGCRLRSADGSTQASAGRHPRLGLTPLFFRLSGISQLIRGARIRRWVRQRLGFLLGPAVRACLDAYAAEDSPLEVETLSGACLMLRHEAIAQVGPLDENFFMYLEDLDYCMRLRQAGWRLYYLPGAELIHLGGQSSGGRMRTQSVRFYQSLFYFYGKHYPARTLLAARLLVLSAVSCRWLWSLIREKVAHGNPAADSREGKDPASQERFEMAQVIALCWRERRSQMRSDAGKTLLHEPARPIR
jgi:GT2 family glycosyltransferase